MATALESLIEQHGGELIRQRKHRVYRFPNGVMFVCASTPSCPLADTNGIAKLKRLLGLIPADRGAPGTRRNKRLKQRDAVGGSRTLPFANHVNHETPLVETWKDKLETVVIKPTPPPPKPPVFVRKPLTFEERMLRAGVKKLDRND